MLTRVAANGAPRFGRSRLVVTVFLGGEHEVGLFADRTRHALTCRLGHRRYCGVLPSALFKSAIVPVRLPWPPAICSGLMFNRVRFSEKFFSVGDGGGTA